MIEKAQRVISDNHDTAKHVVDALVIPSGLVAGITQYIGLVNGLLTIVVLLLNVTWAAYRIVDMRNTQRRTKR